MASPNAKTTTPATPATNSPSNANTAGDQTPSEDEEEVVPATVPEASVAENDPHGHVKAKPNQIGPQKTAMTAPSARTSDAQPQTPPQATTATPAHRDTPPSNEAGASDEEEESEFDDEEDSEADQDLNWHWDDQKPTAPTGEEAGDRIPGHHPAAPVSTTGDDEQVSLVDDMRAYVIDGLANIDGVLIEDSVVADEEVSEGVGEHEGDHDDDDGNEENKSSATATSARRRNESPLGIAPRPDTSASTTPDGNGGQGGGAGDQVLEASGAQMDGSLRDTTGEGEVRDPAVAGLEKSAGR